MNRFFRGGDDDPKKKDDSRDKADDKKEPTSRRMSPPRFGRKDDSDDKKDTGQRSPSGGGSDSPSRRSTDIFNRGRTSPRDKGADKKEDDQGGARPTGVFSQRSSPGSSSSSSNLFNRTRDSESGSSGSGPFRRSSPPDRNRSSAPSSSGSSPFSRGDSPPDRNRGGSSGSGSSGSSPFNRGSSSADRNRSGGSGGSGSSTFGRGSSPTDRNRSGGTGGSGSSPFNRGSSSSGTGSSGSSSRSPFSRGPSPRDRSSSGGPGGGGSSSSSPRPSGSSSGSGSSYRSYGGSTGTSSQRSPAGGPSGGPGARRPSRPAPSRPGDRKRDDKSSDSSKTKKDDKDSAPSRSFFRRGSKPDKKDDKKDSGDKPARPRGTGKSSKSSKPRRERKSKKDTAKSARSSRSSGKAKTLPKQSKAPQNVTQALSLDRKLDLLGIGLMIAALVMFAGWLQSTTAPEGAGGLSGSVDILMAQLFGGARLLIPAAAAIIGGWLIVRHFGTMFDINYFRILGFVLLFFWIVTVLQWWAMLFVEFPSQPNYVASIDELASQSEALWQDGEGGGLVGHIAYMFLVNMLGDYVLVPVLLGWVVFGMMFAFDLSVGSIADSWRERQRTREVRRKERAPVETPATAPTMVAASAGAAAGGGSVAVKEGTEAPTRRHQAAQKTAPPPQKEEKATKPKRRRGLFRRGRTEAPSEEPITPETDGDQPKRASQPTAEDKGRKQAPSDAPITADTDGDQPKRRERSGIFGRRQAPAADKEAATAKKTEAKPDPRPKRRQTETEGRPPSEAPSDRAITPDTDGDQPKRAPKPAAADKGRKQAPSGKPITAETDGDQPKRQAPTDIFGRRKSPAEQQEEATDKAAQQAAEDSQEKEPSADSQPGPARRLLNGLFGRKQEEAPSDKPITTETDGDQPKRAPKPAAEDKRRKQAPSGAPITAETDGDQPRRRTPAGVFGRRKAPGEQAAEDEKEKASATEAKPEPAAERKGEEEAAGPQRRGLFDRPGRRPAEAEVDEKPEAKPERADTERAAQEAPSRRPREADSLARQRRAPTGPLSEETQVTPTRQPSDAAAERRPVEGEGRRQPVTSPFAPTTSSQTSQDIFRRRPPSRSGEEGQRAAEKAGEKPAAPDKRSTQVDQDTPVVQSTSPTPAQASEPTRQLEREKQAAEDEEKAAAPPPDKQLAETTKAEQPAEERPAKTDEPTRQIQSAAAAMPIAEAISEPTRQALQDKAEEDKADKAEKPSPARRPAKTGKDEEEDSGEASSTDEWAVSSSTGRRRPPPFTLANEAPDDVSTADAYRERLARRRPVQPGGADESPGVGRRPSSAPAASNKDEEQPATSASPPAERRGPVFFNREQHATAGRTAPPDGPPTDKSDTQDSEDESTAAAQPARPRGLDFDSSARSMRRRDRRSVFRTSSGDLPTVSGDGSEEKPDEETGEEQKEPLASPQAVKAVEKAVQSEAKEKEETAQAAEAAEQKAATDAKSSEDAGDKEKANEQAAEKEAPVTAKADKAEEETKEDEEDKSSTTATAEAKQEAKSEKDTAKEKAEEQKKEEAEPAEAKQSAKKDKEAEKTEQEQEEEEEPGGSRWIRPDFLELLEGGSVREIDEQILLEQARIIEDTLESFGAPGNIVEINSGPVITQFGIEPAYIEKRGGSRSRVKVSAIASLEKDIALALAARSIRIEAPVPGKGFVGLEVPNTEAALVSLRDVMNSDQHRQKVEKTKLTISLGKRVDGTPLSADLTQMPHLLIAGTTGSGKSVCVNSIIGCLLLQNTPEELQFIMVDPKRVELTGYNGIPHLVAPVVVDLERIVGVLKWVQREMDDRYKRFASISARNILDYNRKIPEGQPNMPYLIVIVDELADLMMLAPEETERLIARLAQMARATGIHLIISTQRPSVDVVTGLIKANFPARIAFAVASSVDSRVILDQPGAEKLLGRGDMLYQAPDAAAPQRMQGVFVSDPELTRITQYWKSTRAVRGKSKAKADGDGEKPERKAEAANKPSIVIRRSAEGESGDGQAASEPARSAGMPNKQQVFWEKLEAVTEAEDDMIDDEDTDELYDDAVELVRRRNKASISMLQRHFRIGYVRAARLIDLMEKQDVIGPAESGSKPRQVLPEDSD